MQSNEQNRKGRQFGQLAHGMLIVANVAMLSLFMAYETRAQTSDNDNLYSESDGQEASGNSSSETCANIHFKTCTEDCGDDKVTLSWYKDEPEPECPAGYHSDGSLIDNFTYNYHHFGYDYRLGRTGSGCTSCGAGGASRDKLLNLQLQRRHRSRDMTQVGSFGPGIFSEYDFRAHVYPVNGGLQLDLFDPGLTAPLRLVDGLNGDVADGVFVDQRNKRVKEARLLDNSGQITSTLIGATKIRVYSFNGTKHDFELMDLDSTYSGSPNGLDYLQLVPEPGPEWQGIWGFEEGSGAATVDSSGSGNDGTISGATWEVGKVGSYALSFDGVNDYLTLGNPASLQIEDLLTFAVWIKPHTASGSQAIIIHKDASTGASVSLKIADGKYKVGTWITANSYAEASIPAEDINQWVHLAGTYNGAIWQLYRNGVKVASKADVVGVPTSINGDWMIGSLSGALPFSGEIDDLRITKQALSQIQIADLVGLNRYGHYPLDEGVGATAGDVSGNSNDGTINGAIWTTGKVGSYALNFDGVDDYLAIGNPVELQATGSITLAAWVKPEALDGNRVIVIHKTPNNGQSVALKILDGKYQISSWDGESSVVADSEVPTNDIAQWVHLVGTYDGAMWRLYRNGVLVTATQSAGSVPQINGDWTIGGLSDGYFYQGGIDDVRIYNRAISANEIASLSQMSLLAGRLVRVEDLRGYAMAFTYRDSDYTPQELADSPDRRWQVRTVTDSHHRQMTFHYGQQQVSGRWAVSQIDLPNNASINYSYADGKLAQVAHPDGATSTFTYGWNAKAQATIFEINDTTAQGTHRRKKAYLSNNIQYTHADTQVDTAEMVNQSSLMIRMLVNGVGKVAYLNMPATELDGNNSRIIYEGRGRLRLMRSATKVQFFEDGWKKTDPSLGENGIVGTLEPTYMLMPYTNHENWYRNTEPVKFDAQGRQYDFTYDDDAYLRSKAYSDGTKRWVSYDANKNIIRDRDRLRRVTKYTYDAQNNMLTKAVGLVVNDQAVDVPQPEHATYSWSYYNGTEGPALTTGNATVDANAANPQPVHLKKSETDANGNVTYFIYDADNFLIAKVDPEDSVGSGRPVYAYTYDTAGRMATSCDPVGRSATYFYDARDRVIQVQYDDNTTERTAYGAPGSGDENLVVAKQDRNGNVTTYVYDDAGRRTQTITAAYRIPYADVTDDTKTDLAALLVVGNEITDPSIRIEETCTYLDGTNLKTSCVRAGEKTEYAYDYRHRVVETTVHPRNDKSLTTRRTYVGNELFKTTDAYGRESYNAYRDSDGQLVRKVQATAPQFTLADENTVFNLVRDLDANAKFLVEDVIKDVEGQLTVHVDARNNESHMSYDSRGRRTQTIEAFGTAVEAKTETLYDANSNVVETRSPRYFDSGDAHGFGKAHTVMTYTGRNLLATRTEAAGAGSSEGEAAESFTYYLDGRAKDHTDFRGHVMTQVWKPCCGRLSVTAQPAIDDPDNPGNTYRPVHFTNTDGYGNVTHTADVKWTDAILPDGSHNPPDAQTLHETTMLYDARNRVFATTRWLQPLGFVDPDDVPIAEPYEITAGLTTRYIYDEDLTDGVGLDSAAGFAVDFANTAGTGNTSGSVSIKALIDELTADGVTFDGTNQNGYAVAVINPNGEISVSITDGAGRSVAQGVIEPPIVNGVANANANNVITWSTTVYDTIVALANTFDGGISSGDVVETASVDASDDVTRSRSDGAGRTLQSVDQLANITKLTYDNNSNRLSVRDPNNIGDDCVFDPRNRRTSCTDTQGDTTSTAYDHNSIVITTTDAKSHSTTSVFDARGRRLTVTDRNNGTTTYAYDFNNNLTRIIDADSATLGITDYEYDPRNLKIKATYPTNSGTPGTPGYEVVEYTYDAAGRSLVNTDQLGDTTSYVFDMADRLLQRKYRLSGAGSDESVDTFTYDPASRMLTAVKGRYGNTVTMTYDTAGRTASESLTVASQIYTTFRAYDADNRNTQLTYPDGSIVDRTYTDRDQLQQVDYNSSMVASFTYDDAMRKTQRVLGDTPGTTTAYTYGRNDNLVTAITDAADAARSFTYAYDANKNPTAETTGGVMAGYSFTAGYDTEDRLTSWIRANGTDSQTWNLSLVGDWNSTTINGVLQNRTHNAVHEATVIGGNSQTFDAKGNQLTDTQGRTFTWDIDNKMATSNASAAGGSATLSFTYDALGRRVSKNDGTTTTVYVCAGQQVVAERAQTNGGGNPPYWSAIYVFGTYVDEPLMKVDASSNRHYYHTNRLYCVTAMTDTVGTVIERYAYTAYGVTAILDPTATTARATSSVGNPYMYTGRRLDNEFASTSADAIYFYRARYYDPQQGRFIGRDPLEYLDGMLMYEYAKNGALKCVDPNGLRKLAGIGPDGIPIVTPVTDGLWDLFTGLLTGDIFDEEPPAPAASMRCTFVLFVNGITNTDKYARESFLDLIKRLGISEEQAQQIANGTHGFRGGKDQEVFIDGPMAVELLQSHGDLLQVLLEQMRITTLAGERVRQAITDMANAANANGCCCYTIHVFAHSQGTATFRSILKDLPDDIKAQISYHGSGPQSVIGDDEGLGVIDNVVHEGDPVPELGDPLGWDRPHRRVIPHRDTYPWGDWPNPGATNNHNFRNYYVDQYNESTLRDTSACPEGDG
ncbi:hypothetical protein HED60_04475 [Planctomycetales bacterium ZRK34]|nr:hypothetical protein HED60_04475 [Planctomycetales bacterium ZRK34]